MINGPCLLSPITVTIKNSAIDGCFTSIIPWVVFACYCEKRRLGNYRWRKFNLETEGFINFGHVKDSLIYSERNLRPCKALYSFNVIVIIFTIDRYFLDIMKETPFVLIRQNWHTQLKNTSKRFFPPNVRQGTRFLSSFVTVDSFVYS